MHLVELTGILAHEQFDSRKAKAAGAQALNTRLFYDLTCLNRVSATSVFTYLVSNDDLVAHNVAALSLQCANVSKEPNIYVHLILYRTWYNQSASSTETRITTMGAISGHLPSNLPPRA